jgi:hypothetical protein
MEGHIWSSRNWKKKEMTMKRIKIQSKKTRCHERRKVIQEEIKVNKQNYGWGVTLKTSKHIDIRRKKGLSKP